MATTTAELRLQELLGHLGTIQAQVRRYHTMAETEAVDTRDGLSLLDVKHHTLLEYITNLVFVIHLRLSGRSVANHPVVHKLIEDRVVLEKIGPIEQKLKYQIDKVVRAATMDHPEQTYKEASTSLRAMDPLQFKPSMANMTNTDELSGTDGEDDTAEAHGTKGVYQPPKMTPMHYQEDTGLAARQAKYEQRLRERAARSHMVKELMQDMDDRPEQSTVHGNASVSGLSHAERKYAEQQKYEENHFVRLTMSRKDKHQLKQTQLNRLDDEFKNLNDFATMATLRSADKGSRDQLNLLTRVKARRERDEQDLAPAAGPSSKRARKKHHH
ncbi:hypothetical protein H4R35_004816 [Dimargaris xerosporica]|nr:hypothetical protein H4R35_004816 [Dimargaris xerosporica]